MAKIGQVSGNILGRLEKGSLTTAVGKMSAGRAALALSLLLLSAATELSAALGFRLPPKFWRESARQSRKALTPDTVQTKVNKLYY